jgi:hypothetical protein
VGAISSVPDSTALRYGVFLEAIPDAIIGVDADGSIVLVNSQAETLFGYSRKELIGERMELLVPKSVRYLHPGYDTGYYHDAQTRLMGDGAELAGRRKDGTEFSAEISLASLAAEDGILVSAAIRDITPRKRAEARFRGLIEAAPDAIVAVDIEGAISLVNAQTEALFGYKRSELLGQSLEILLPEASREIHPLHRQQYFSDPRTRLMGVGMKLAGRRKDGSEFPAEIALSSIDTEEGLLVSADIRDVSVRAEVQRAQEKLEAQLHQSQRLESLGQLAGGVAHDFNNLLAAILNYASFVSDEVAKDASRGGAEGVRYQAVLADCDQITAAAEGAARLTNQLLAFGRREVVQPQILSVNAIVTEVETLLGRTIGEHVTLVTCCDSDLAAVRADKGQVEQVLLNLAVNARYAMPTGGTLTIATDNFEVGSDYADRHPGLTPGRYARVRVADTGVGMAPETLQHAFEPFYTTKPKGEGSGLGLATVYGIVAQADGRVLLHSSVGLGTTVTVLLPAMEAALSDPEILRARVDHGGGETILVVEDGDAMREVARRVLSSHGYHVLLADGGAAALELARTHDGSIELLLTDVVMPGLRGHEVAAAVAQMRTDIRVLYMSGYADAALTSEGILGPEIHLISKPFTAPILLEKVREVLDS